jgi:hypothetical protein
MCLGIKPASFTSLAKTYVSIDALFAPTSSLVMTWRFFEPMLEHVEEGGRNRVVIVGALLIGTIVAQDERVA